MINNITGIILAGGKSMIIVETINKFKDIFKRILMFTYTKINPALIIGAGALGAFLK